jgi:hypothetical protein
MTNKLKIVYGGLTNTMKDYQLGITTRAEFTSELNSLTLFVLLCKTLRFPIKYGCTNGFLSLVTSFI